MATKIRLKRCGAKKQPHYRVVVMEAAGTRDGRAIEEIGWHNPLTDPATTEIREDRALHWLLCGAQPTETVAALLKKAGLMERLQAARTGEQPAAEEPAAEQPAAEEPAAEQPAAEQPAAEEPAVEPPATD